MSLTTKAQIKISLTQGGAQTAFTPKILNLTFDSLVSADSGRTDDGVNHIYWVKSRIRKIEIEMPPCSAQQASSILSLVQGKKYYLTYYDVIDNAEKTIYVYTSNSKAECYSGALHNGLYKGIKFNAIEIAGENV